MSLPVMLLINKLICFEDFLLLFKPVIGAEISNRCNHI